MSDAVARETFQVSVDVVVVRDWVRIGCIPRIRRDESNGGIESESLERGPAGDSGGETAGLGMC